MPDLVEALASDESVYVKIPVTEALARLGHLIKGVMFLANTLDSWPEHSGQAAGPERPSPGSAPAALPHKAVVDRAAVSTDEYVKNAGRYLKFVLEGTYTPQTPIYVA